MQSYKHWTPHQSSKHIILPRVQKARRRLSLRCVVLKQTVAATVYIQCFPIVLHDDSWPATTTVEMDSQLLLLDDTYPTTLQYLHDGFQIKPWIQNANLLWGYGSKGSQVMSFRAFHRSRVAENHFSQTSSPCIHRYLEIPRTRNVAPRQMWLCLLKCLSLSVWSLCMTVIIGIRAWQQRKCNEPPYLFSFANQSFVFESTDSKLCFGRLEEKKRKEKTLGTTEALQYYGVTAKKMSFLYILITHAHFRAGYMCI